MKITVNIDDVISKINNDFGELFHCGPNGVQSKVCLLCNRHLRCKKVFWIPRKTILRRHKLLLPITPISPQLKKVVLIKDQVQVMK